jgi:hypothetical protein
VAIAVALVTLILVVLRRRAPEAPDRERIPSTNPVAAFLGFLVASAWALLVAGVFATGVGWTTWVATPAFGTRGDYAALVLAVATSGSIAGIASAMLLVRRGAKSS